MNGKEQKRLKVLNDVLIAVLPWIDVSLLLGLVLNGVLVDAGKVIYTYIRRDRAYPLTIPLEQKDNRKEAS